MNKYLTTFLVIALLFANACKKDDTASDPPAAPIGPEGYTLIWADEFDGSTIDMANWNFQTGDGTAYGLPPGWGNQELQIYTDKSENASIMADQGNSVLAITALKDNANGYTSARMTTESKVSMRYGRIDVKAKMPQGKGLWPAIWLLGDNIDVVSWPGCGEIDIVEVLGHNPDTLYTTLHYTNGEQKKGEIQNTHGLATGTYSDDYHVYSMDWTPESLSFSLDGQFLYEVPIADDMKEFQRSAYILLNVAVGGYWPGNPDASTVFPQSMYVDYVRVYSKDGMQIPDAPILNIEEETIGQVIEPNIGDHAIREGFTILGSLEVISYGGGGEPFVTASDTAIDGDKSLVFDFPGGSWGGAYIELASPVNLSSYSYIKFSLNYPVTLANAEIKLESPSSNASIYLADYTGSPVADGFVEYTIPLADFNGLNTGEISIPFAIWNPQNYGGSFVTAMILIDNLYFTN